MNQICFKSKISNKGVSKNRSIKVTNLALKKYELIGNNYGFDIENFFENGVHRNCHVRALAYLIFILYVHVHHLQKIPQFFIKMYIGI